MSDELDLPYRLIVVGVTFPCRILQAAFFYFLVSGNDRILLFLLILRTRGLLYFRTLGYRCASCKCEEALRFPRQLVCLKSFFPVDADWHTGASACKASTAMSR